MEYKFGEIEAKWKEIWQKNGLYKVTEDPSKPKFYVLDMFPYPSGAGLHVGHPLGYVASDIYARYKRLKGFNVLHPMGYDAFGLPAEQYAIETGTHPAITTEKAIKRYREQLDKIGFSFDWDRQVKTCDPDYYKWTQWIFLKLFNSWYNREKNKAEPIETLIEKFEKENHCNWKTLNNAERMRILMDYRLAYLSYAEVNWCPALGTVLANDEVKDGKSERGGHPVERKKMRQWFLRITEYSDRLLEGLDRIDWSESMKDMQRNWIGRSEGALIRFQILTPDPSPKERGTPRFMTGKPEVANENLVRAKQHRNEPTEAEEQLWHRIKNHKLGYKFRRQHLIDKYIVDFVCLEKKLVVEVDGAIHLLTKAEDEARTEVLKQLGYEVIRFTNEEVLQNGFNIAAQIRKELDALHPEGSASPSPSERGAGGEEVVVFTTRPDTIFGATFMVLSPEHELIPQLTTKEQQAEIENYQVYVKSRTDVERQQEKKVTGAFTGSYAVNPFTEQPIPIYIAEYVLAGYGTGAIMAVPADDERDHRFAEKFGLPVVQVIDRSMYPDAKMEDKVGKMINSGFLNGMEVKDAIKAVIAEIEKRGIGQKKVNYKQHDAGFSRQRYWGEPFPIRYKIVGQPDPPFEGGESDDIPMPLSENDLPLILPEVSSFKPTGDGHAPLANNEEWMKNHYETDTMPGYAGSSWYCLRYMDPKNDKEFASKEKMDYWQNVDIYFGGAEHAVGHLLYARMWHKFLFDLGYVPTDEPFKKLVNQGMIQGVSRFIYRGSKKSDVIIPVERIEDDDITVEELKTIGVNSLSDIGFPIEIHVDINLVDENGFLKVEEFRKWRPEYADAKFLFDKNGKYPCGSAVEKMSKSKHNVINPDDVIEKYGADCFRMFEMFLGPIEQSKPWDDKGISGVSNFLKKFWRLYVPLIEGAASPSPLERGPGGEVATDAELKVLHKTLKKIADDIERLNFNTCISAFMIATNELTALNCHKRAILEPLLIALAPFAPFITEELWEKLGHKDSIHKASYPKVEEKYLVENTHTYGVSVNGKVRAEINLPLDITPQDAEKEVLALESITKWTNGNPPKKFIFVKGKIINVVV